jgi:pyruvate dehydrogenase E2 component (dihydrolipoamide acetyltransferase)
MRKTIAKRLAASKFSAPHFYLTMEINMDKAMEVRKDLNEALAPAKVSFNDLIVKAAALALRKHPQVNASWMEDRIRMHQHVHVGVAVAVEQGLLVPVIKFADAKNFAQIAQDTNTLAGKAKAGQLKLDEMQGNTFTVSNLGMFDIDEFTAIINSPESCIMAVGKIKETPVVKDGAIKVSSLMKVTLSCDHRVVDGATGAKFLQTFKQLLENPLRMLI